MKTYLIGLILVLLVSSVRADTLIADHKTYKGMLQGYENNYFIFKTTDWKTIKKPRTSIKKFIPDIPYDTSYTIKGVLYPAKFIKYETPKFFFKSKEGQETTIHGVKIKTLKIETHSPFTANSGEQNRGKQGLKTSLNLKEIAASENLTITQKTAIKRYIEARKAYIKFHKESNALIRQRDQANDKKREDLINELHLRKNAEQPIINELTTSVLQLESEFADNVQ